MCLLDNFFNGSLVVFILISWGVIILYVLWCFNMLFWWIFDLWLNVFWLIIVLFLGIWIFVYFEIKFDVFLVFLRLRVVWVL